MVETSVAVATPSTTAVRIRNGSSRAGSATRSVLRTTAAAAGFAWPWQRELLTPYMRQLPEALLALGAVDSTFARNWFRAASLGLWGDPAAALTAIGMTEPMLGELGLDSGGGRIIAAAAAGAGWEIIEA